MNTQQAIYAAGCFWGVEYLFKKLNGVINTEVGYTGGNQPNPTYEEVCKGNTGHFEAIRITFDPKIISYEQLTKFFFEIHDPTQTNGQGPDIGQQYLSVIFYKDESQKSTAEALKKILQNQGLDVNTQILPEAKFWVAEEYHQNYYEKTGKHPYCHFITKRFK